MIDFNVIMDAVTALAGAVSTLILIGGTVTMVTELTLDRWFDA